MNDPVTLTPIEVRPVDTALCERCEFARFCPAQNAGSVLS